MCTCLCLSDVSARKLPNFTSLGLQLHLCNVRCQTYEMDQGLRAEDRNGDYHDGRPDARERRPDRGQRDYRDRRGDDGWARGPRSGTDDWRSGAPRPSGGRQFETRYDSQALQHQPRSEAMAVRNSSARRDEPPRRRDEPSLKGVTVYISA